VGGGVSWEDVESDADIVRRVVNFLEDRRVLYQPLDAEIFAAVGQSIRENRREGSALVQKPTSWFGPSRRRSALRKLNIDLGMIE
jgi:hypothetical protein